MLRMNFDKLVGSLLNESTPEAFLSKEDITPKEFVNQIKVDLLAKITNFHKNNPKKDSNNWNMIEASLGSNLTNRQRNPKGAFFALDSRSTPNNWIMYTRQNGYLRQVHAREDLIIADPLPQEKRSNNLPLLFVDGQPQWGQKIPKRKNYPLDQFLKDVGDSVIKKNLGKITNTWEKPPEGIISDASGAVYQGQIQLGDKDVEKFLRSAMPKEYTDISSYGEAKLKGDILEGLNKLDSYHTDDQLYKACLFMLARLNIYNEFAEGTRKARVAKNQPSEELKARAEERRAARAKFLGEPEKGKQIEEPISLPRTPKTSTFDVKSRKAKK